MTRSKAEDAGGLTPAKDDNAAPYHFDRRTLPIFKCVDYKQALSRVIWMKNRIKDQREDHDYTQQWPDELLVRLANFYQTSVDDLLLLTDEPRPYPRR